MDEQVTTNPTPIVEVNGITKSFGVTQALRGVDLQIGAGEVVALMGENGAGKSTLGKVIAGVHRPDAGTVRVDGQEVSFGSTRDALEYGIAIVLQEFNLIPDMTVAENLCLTRDDGYLGSWWRNSKRQRQIAINAINSLELDFGIDPDALVSSLSIAKQQIIEIVRSMSADARLFILDEPTAALGRREVEALLAIIRRLKANGSSVVIVTHRLDEVYAVSDRIAVLRDGAGNGEFDPETTGQEEVVKAMVGRELGAELQAARKRTHDAGEVVLDVNDLVVAGVSNPVSFSVRQGEIIGIAGLVGAGRSELVRAIFGADEARSGNVSVSGRVGLMKSPSVAVDNGLALVPEDRKGQGLHLNLSIHENATLAVLARKGGFWLHDRDLRKAVAEKISDLRIKIGDIDDLASSLSGGNQQKVVLAKWLLAEPEVLVLDEPTRGVDVGARADFYRLIDALVEKGLAVIVISSELPEVMALADRILVMNQGEIVAELPGDDTTEAEILSYTDVGKSGTNEEHRVPVEQTQIA